MEEVPNGIFIIFTFLEGVHQVRSFRFTEFDRKTLSVSLPFGGHYSRLSDV